MERNNFGEYMEKRNNYIDRIQKYLAILFNFLDIDKNGPIEGVPYLSRAVKGRNLSVLMEIIPEIKGAFRLRGKWLENAFTPEGYATSLRMVDNAEEGIKYLFPNAERISFG